MTDKKNDILITEGTILTMDDSLTIIKDGAVAVKKDKIIAVGSQNEFSNANAKTVIDAHNGIIMPGVVNTHTHASMTCFRGLVDDIPLMTWLNDYIFPAESKLTSDIIYKGALLACAEMIMSGTTCFCDMYIFEDSVAMAAKQAEMRALVGEVLFDFPSPNYGTLEKGLEYTKMLIDKWEKDPLINIAAMPHSPYLCSPDIFTKAFSISKDYKIPLLTHLSETKAEVLIIKKKYNKTPVNHLADIGVLSQDFIACHAVILTKEDINLLTKFDVKISHNPQSNMKLASGIAPVDKLIKKGLRVAIGTDGCASNNDLDMFSEMDTVAKLHKVNTFDPTVMDAVTVLKMGTINGAKVLEMDAVVGSIEVGKKADIIIVDTEKPHLTPMYNPYSHLVYCAKGSDVSTSIINGKVVMKDRALLTLDIEKVMRDVKDIAKSLRR